MLGWLHQADDPRRTRPSDSDIQDSLARGDFGCSEEHAFGARRARGSQVGANQIKEERNDVEPTEVLFSCGVSVCVFVRGGRSEPALEANGSLPRCDLGILVIHGVKRWGGAGPSRQAGLDAKLGPG